MTRPAEIVELLARDPDGASREQSAEVLAAAEAHRSWVAAREAKWARHFEALDKDPSSPAKDLADEMQQKQKVGRGEARKRSERAKQLNDLPGTESALEDGEITDAHADVLARARAKADAEARAALEEHEAELLAHARRESPFEFAKRVERFVQKHSQDDGRSAWDKAKGRQRLSLTNTGDGMTRINGLLAPELAQRARTVLGKISDQLYRRDHQELAEDAPVPPLERTNEQRLAEAFDQVLRHAQGQDGPARHTDQAVVVLSYDDLVGRDGPGAGQSTLADGTPIPASVARQLACDAGKIPMVLGGRSVKLDLGRSQRDPSPAQGRAIRLIWGSCSFGPCHAPIEYTQNHHVEPYHENGHMGPTDIGNLTPVCTGNCHDLAHTPGWTFTKDPLTHVTTTIAPDGTTWIRQPNGPGITASGRRRPTEPPPAAADPPGQPAAATLFTEHAA